MIKVYIASPYTNGNQAANVRAAMDAAEQLINAGFCPVQPLLSHFHELVYPHSYETWLKIGYAMIDVCDCVLRLPGESKGADMECKYAFRNNIRVFFSVNEIIKRVVCQNYECKWSYHNCDIDLRGNCGKCGAKTRQA